MIISPTDPDIMRQLVRRTDYYHDRFDAQYETMLFFDQTRENYHQFVRRLYGFYKAAEDRLAKLQEGCIPALLSRVPAIVKDLHVFGETAETIQQIPLCQDTRLDMLYTLHGVMGYLYIIEGSLFGNDLVAQALQQALQIESETGTAFFHVIPFEQIIPRFDGLSAMLRGYAAEHPEAKEEIIQGALDTILAYENWLFAGRIIRIKRIDSALHGHTHGHHDEEHEHEHNHGHAHIEH
ncbi:MAG TPA: biliverdin-producing heme oxygenase [Ktedonobacteraceae bacterium]|nr:biliverdin-producing heme oxygenase [Ktedonobacteraceae bacterium]